MKSLQLGSFGRPSETPRARHYWHLRRGRYALWHAYRMAGIEPGQTLLAPAYHCRTMLDPAIALGAEVVLYPLHPDLSPNLEAIERLLAAPRSHAPRALLATHYFGIPQDFGVLASLCQAHGTTLIEDCSHAMVLDPSLAASLGPGGRIGTYADLGISSPYKFLPSQDGGLLWCNTAVQASAPRLSPPPRGLALRAAVELARELGRSQPAPLEAVAPGTLPDPAQAVDPTEPSTGPSADYHEEERDWTSLSSTRWLMRHTRLDTLATQRRHRYRQWLAAVQGLAGCRPLHAGLDESTVPYMFPLLLDAAWPAFHRLKHAGVPIWRWDQMAVSDCAVATDYRLRLLHLPCHQGLSDAQMDWMIATLAEVMTASQRTTGAVR